MKRKHGPKAAVIMRRLAHLTMAGQLGPDAVANILEPLAEALQEAFDEGKQSTEKHDDQV